MLMKIVRGCGSLIASYWNSFSTKGKIWLILAVVAVVVDATLCYEYGVKQTTAHGIGFAVVALFFSQLPDGAYEEYEKGNKGAGIVLALLCIPIGAVAYQSHVGYGAGVRTGDVRKAAIQQTKYDGAQDTVTEDKANLSMWTAQLAKLTELNAWATTTKADGLREELKTLKDRMTDEESGKRGRKAGKGKEFEGLQDKANALQAKIDAVEKVADLTTRIEATKRKLDAAREKASHTEAGLSSVAMQTEANTQLFGVIRAAWTGEPLEAAMKTTEQSSRLANLLITALGSLAFMLMAPIGFFMANRNRNKEAAPSSYSFTPSLPKLSAPQQIHTREIVKTDNGFAARAVAALDDPKLRNAIESLRGFKTA